MFQRWASSPSVPPTSQPSFLLSAPPSTPRSPVRQARGVQSWCPCWSRGPQFAVFGGLSAVGPRTSPPSAQACARAREKLGSHPGGRGLGCQGGRAGLRLGPRVHRPVVREGLDGALCRCPWSTWAWPVAAGGIPEHDRRGHFKGSLWCSWGEEGAHRRGGLWGAPCSCRAPRAPR